MIIYGATCQGVMHRNYGVKNQDSYRIEVLDDISIAVVCDGVSLNTRGVFSNSELASSWCAGFICRFLREYLDPSRPLADQSQVMINAFKDCNDGLNRYLEDKGIYIYDCQTTVVLMIYQKGVLLAGIAGDGGIVYMCKDGQPGFFITRTKTSSQVDPICDVENWKFFMYNNKANPVYAALAATDGIFDQLLTFSHGIPFLHKPLLDAFFNISKVPRKQRQRYLQALVNDVRSHDDKTVAVVFDGKEKNRK